MVAMKGFRGRAKGGIGKVGGRAVTRRPEPSRLMAKDQQPNRQGSGFVAAASSGRSEGSRSHQSQRLARSSSCRGRAGLTKRGVSARSHHGWRKEETTAKENRPKVMTTSVNGTGDTGVAAREQYEKGSILALLRGEEDPGVKERGETQSKEKLETKKEGAGKGDEEVPMLFSLGHRKRKTTRAGDDSLARTGEGSGKKRTRGQNGMASPGNGGESVGSVHTAEALPAEGTDEKLLHIQAIFSSRAQTPPQRLLQSLNSQAHGHGRDLSSVSTDDDEGSGAASLTAEGRFQAYKPPTMSTEKAHDRLWLGIQRARAAANAARFREKRVLGSETQKRALGEPTTKEARKTRIAAERRNPRVSNVAAEKAEEPAAQEDAGRRGSSSETEKKERKKAGQHQSSELKTMSVSDDAQEATSTLPDRKDRISGDRGHEESQLAEAEERNSRTLFVGNLPLTPWKPAELFTHLGLAKKDVETMRLRSVPVLPKFHNCRLGGIVNRQFTAAKDFQNAYVVLRDKSLITSLLRKDGLSFQGCSLRIDTVGAEGDGGFSKFDRRRTVFVGNLPPRCSETDLREALKANGPVKAVRIIRDKVTSESKGFGFVCFEDRVSVAKAVLTSNGVAAIQGRTLRVMRALDEETSKLEDEKRRSEREKSSAYPKKRQEKRQERDEKRARRARQRGIDRSVPPALRRIMKKKARKLEKRRLNRGRKASTPRD